MEQAKKSYEEFIAAFPNHELAKSANYSLQNLGKSPEDIINSFENKK